MHLILDKLSHAYGDTKVIDEISVEISPGEIVCLVGPSGCGKSTLLRMIGGLEQPQSGRVVQQGNIPNECLNPLTYIFQDFALLPWRSVWDNVSLVLEDHHLPKSERDHRIEDALKRTNLLDFAHAFPKQLSGGMKQRVAIARALVVKPAVMLMDEPLSALDSQTRDILIEDLVSLWTRQQFTAVYVTHNLNEAVRLGHKIILLSRRPGKIRNIIEIDTPIAERDGFQEDIAQKQRELWLMLKSEAKTADREFLHG